MSKVNQHRNVPTIESGNTNSSNGVEAMIAKYGVADTFLDTEKLPWVKYVAENMWYKPLRFDTANHRTDIILDIRAPGVLGRHQHQGEVTAYTIAGSWHYKEYDWVARAGDVVHESPGGIHTLVAGEQGMKTLFHIVGPIDFFGDDGSFTGEQSVFWWMAEYVKHCRKTGLAVEKRLFY